MEIIQERLEREYNLDLITTAPSVIYRITKTDGEVVYIDNPTQLPGPFPDPAGGRADGQRPYLRPQRLCGEYHGFVPGTPGCV